LEHGAALAGGENYYSATVASRIQAAAGELSRARGDTLLGIADRYSVSLTDVRKWNRLR